jgi:hypothetical protein
MGELAQLHSTDQLLTSMLEMAHQKTRKIQLNLSLRAKDRFGNTIGL